MDISLFLKVLHRDFDQKSLYSMASYTFGCREGRSAEEPGSAGVFLSLYEHRRERKRREEHMTVLRFRTRSSHSRRANAPAVARSPRLEPIAILPHPPPRGLRSRPTRRYGGQGEPTMSACRLFRQALCAPAVEDKTSGRSETETCMHTESRNGRPWNSFRIS